MRLAVGVASAATLMLWPALSGCTASGPTATAEQRPRALVVAEARSDVGNGRPQVSSDGLMVRRRLVFAVRLAPRADPAAVHRHLQRAALRSHTTVTPISPTVLDPVPLDQLSPDLVVTLAADATPATGQRLLDLALRDRAWSSSLRAGSVLSVLVHDLRLTVRTPRPTALARAIAREGILSDALGNYTEVPRAGTLRILYTGPLLSDRLLRSVQAGIARAALVAPAAVSVAPRTRAGVGVDLTQEPIPAEVVEPPSTGHDH